MGCDERTRPKAQIDLSHRRNAQVRGGRQKGLAIREWTGVPKPNEMPEIPSAEQLFVPTLVWAYFNAYATILRTNVLIFRMAQNGIDRIDDLLSIENIRKALKAALPHQAKFIDENEVARYYYLLDEIESSLLTELQKVTADQASASRAKEINDAIKRATAQQTEASTAKILAS